MKNKLFLIEESLKSLEKAMDIKITIIDNHGCFHAENGKALLGPLRQSHRKNKVCELGFCHKCPEHCRFAMNEKGMKEKSAFIHECWKGLQELVIPLTNGNMHYGSLFAGIWRSEKARPKIRKELPPQFMAEFEMLPLPDNEKIRMLEKILSVYAAGIISLLEAENSIRHTGDSRILIINELIYKRASEKLRLGDMAKALHLSESRTSHIVKRLSGKSFQELLLAERIKRAKTLLYSSGSSLAEIAELSGFSDEYHFSRIFKRCCGTSPGCYRKNAKS